MPSRFSQTSYRHADREVQREFERISQDNSRSVLVGAGLSTAGNPAGTPDGGGENKPNTATWALTNKLDGNIVGKPKLVQSQNFKNRPSPFSSAEGKPVNSKFKLTWKNCPDQLRSTAEAGEIDIELEAYSYWNEYINLYRCDLTVPYTGCTLLDVPYLLQDSSKWSFLKLVVNGVIFHYNPSGTADYFSLTRGAGLAGTLGWTGPYPLETTDEIILEL